MLRQLLRGSVAALVMSLLFAVVPSAQAQSQQCFTETGHCIQGRFLQFWQQNGGLAVFGFPTSQELVENNRPVQYFERQRFELHPENAAPYDVQLGLLGAEVLANNGIDWQTQPTSPGGVAGCYWFEQTRHNLCDQEVGNGFLSYWVSHGLEFDGQAGKSYAESLALFGFPITEAYTTQIDGKDVQVMWFERARFEWHADNPAEYKVLLGRVGAEIQGTTTVAPLPDTNPSTVPLQGTQWQLVSHGLLNQPTAAAGNSFIVFNADGSVGGNSGCNTFAGSYTLTSSHVNFTTPMISTMMACSDELNQQERVIYDALQGSVRFQQNGDLLHLLYNNEQSMLTYRAGVAAPAAEAPTTTAQLTGTVSYRERMALPNNAIVTVQLLDTSLQDVPATTIAELSVETKGQQVPISFILDYDPSKIDQNHTYSVRATIYVDDVVWYDTTQAYLVLTNGNPSTVDIVLERIQHMN